MATRVSKPLTDDTDLIPEGPELDSLIKAMVAEADADPRPGIPMAEVFEGLRRRHAERLLRGT